GRVSPCLSCPPRAVANGCVPHRLPFCWLQPRRTSAGQPSVGDPISSFGAPERNGATRRRRGPCSLSIGEDSAPRVVGAPDARTQALELNDLAVVDEQVD